MTVMMMGMPISKRSNIVFAVTASYSYSFQ